MGENVLDRVKLYKIQVCSARYDQGLTW